MPYIEEDFSETDEVNLQENASEGSEKQSRSMGSLDLDELPPASASAPPHASASEAPVASATDAPASSAQHAGEAVDFGTSSPAEQGTDDGEN